MVVRLAIILAMARDDEVMRAKRAQPEELARALVQRAQQEERREEGVIARLEVTRTNLHHLKPVPLEDPLKKTSAQ